MFSGKTLAMLSLIAVTPLSAIAQDDDTGVAVRVSTVEKRTMTESTWVPGTVVSLNDARIATEIAGRVEWVAEVGDQVPKGGLLARIDDRPWQLQLKEDEAGIKRLEASLAFMEKQAKRLNRLIKMDTAAESELDELQARRDMTQQDLEQARIAREQTLYNIERTRVTAPFGGSVAARSATAGEFINRGMMIVRLVDTDHMEIRAMAPLSVAAWLEAGIEVAVKSSYRQASAQLRAVVPIGDERSRMMEVRVQLGKGWVIGQAVRVALPSGGVREVIAAPRDALILRQDDIYVFKLKDDGTAARISVKTGAGDGDFIEVTGEIQAGEQVIVRGGERLREGQKVNIL